MTKGQNLLSECALFINFGFHNDTSYENSVVVDATRHGLESYSGSLSIRKYSRSSYQTGEWILTNINTPLNGK